MDIFESLENLKVSEACFDEILVLIEGVMDDIKAGMSPEKAKKKWVDDKNKEYVKSVDDANKARRIARKARKKFEGYLYHGKDDNVSMEDTHALEDKFFKASKNKQAKFNTQLKANYHSKAGKGKMVLPTYSQDGHTHITGFEKGGRKYTPKK